MSHPFIASIPAIAIGQHTIEETKRAELERLTKIAAPLMEAIPSSLEYRLEAILLKAAEIYADRLTKGLS
jgi:hypothetical protein